MWVCAGHPSQLLLSELNGGGLYSTVDKSPSTLFHCKTLLVIIGASSEPDNPWSSEHISGGTRGSGRHEVLIDNVHEKK